MIVLYLNFLFSNKYLQINQFNYSFFKDKYFLAVLIANVLANN